MKAANPGIKEGEEYYEFTFYLAGSLSNRTLMSYIAERLLSTFTRKIEVENPQASNTSIWVWPRCNAGWLTGDIGTDLGRMDRAYCMDIEQGVERADILLAIYPYGNHGTISELGYAAGRGIPFIYIRNALFSDEDPLITGGLTKWEDAMKFNYIYMEDLFAVPNRQGQRKGIIAHSINSASLFMLKCINQNNGFFDLHKTKHEMDLY